MFFLKKNGRIISCTATEEMNRESKLKYSKVNF